MTSPTNPLQSTYRFLTRLPRVLATGFCFAVFFLGGLAVSLTLIPIIHLLPGLTERKQQRCRFLVHKLFVFFVWLMELFSLIKVRLHNVDALRDGRAGLIVANHPTLIDVVIMISKIPNTNCIAKAEMFRNPYVKRVVRACGYISNESGESLLNGAKQSLTKQLPILVFPEGSRSVPGKPLQFKRGAANIAVRTEAQLLPVFITCRPITLTKGAPWWAVPEKRANIDLWVQHWQPTSDFVDDLNDPPAAARKFTQALLNYFEKGLEHV